MVVKLRKDLGSSTRRVPAAPSPSVGSVLELLQVLAPSLVLTLYPESLDDMEDIEDMESLGGVSGNEDECCGGGVGSVLWPTL